MERFRQTESCAVSLIRPQKIGDKKQLEPIVESEQLDVIRHAAPGVLPGASNKFVLNMLRQLACRGVRLKAPQDSLRNCRRPQLDAQAARPGRAIAITLTGWLPR